MAWGAHLRRGSDVVRVFHGPWVETHGDWFVEGAWTGDFEKGELDAALFNVGSGGVLRNGQAVFVSPTDVRSRIYSARRGDDLFFSNSMVFALHMAGDELDACHPYYHADVVRMFVVGISVPVNTLATRTTRGLQCHDSCQVAVGPDLVLRRIEKPKYEAPRSYSHYVETLRGVMEGVLRNADSPARRHARYKAIATVSGGYDANALAAIAASLGVRDSLCFYDRTPGDDGGPEIARLLRLEATEYGKMQFRSVPDLCEAEFLTWPGGHDIVMAPCEPVLAQRLIIIGRYGDTALSMDPDKARGEFRISADYMGGGAMHEFRMRVGFFDFNVFYAAALHAPRICEISRSDEMRPWSIGGEYDRPIGRRIVEEAGVPREMFGIKKSATLNFPLRSTRDLSESSRNALRSFLRSQSMTAKLRRASSRALVKMRSAFEAGARGLGGPESSLGRLAASLIPIPERFQGYDEIAFSTAWAHTVIRERYASAVEQISNAKSP